jgi:hypothetical protein
MAWGRHGVQSLCDGCDGPYFDAALVIRCTDDQEAIRQARQYLDGTAVEVWQDRKLVAKLAPEDG